MFHPKLRNIKINGLLVVILLLLSFSCIQPVTSRNTESENNIIMEEEIVKIEDNSPLIDPVETKALTTINIAYPQIGKLYNRNTLGEEKTILQLFKCSLVIDRNLEAGATVEGDVDEVEFILYKDSQQVETIQAQQQAAGSTCRLFPTLSDPVHERGRQRRQPDQQSNDNTHSYSSQFIDVRLACVFSAKSQWVVTHPTTREKLAKELIVL